MFDGKKAEINTKFRSKERKKVHIITSFSFVNKFQEDKLLSVLRHGFKKVINVRCLCVS